MTVTALYEVPLGVCTQDPDRWTTTPDDEAKTLCRACPRRWLCARDAVESAGCGRAVGRGRNSRIRPGAGIRVGPAAIPGRAQRLPGARPPGVCPIGMTQPPPGPLVRGVCGTVAVRCPGCGQRENIDKISRAVHIARRVAPARIRRWAPRLTFCRPALGRSCCCRPGQPARSPGRAAVCVGGSRREVRRHRRGDLQDFQPRRRGHFVAHIDDPPPGRKWGSKGTSTTGCPWSMNSWASNDLVRLSACPSESLSTTMLRRNKPVRP